MARRVLLFVGLFAVTTVIAVGAGGAQASGGTLDPTFGKGGKVVTHPGGRPAAASAVAVQPDGKIVAAGYTYKDRGGGSNFRWPVYTIGGELDPGFGSGRSVLTDLGGDKAFAVAIRRDREDRRSRRRLARPLQRAAESLTRASVATARWSKNLRGTSVPWRSRRTGTSSAAGSSRGDFALGR